jgi:hypothetical protein
MCSPSLVSTTAKTLHFDIFKEIHPEIFRFRYFYNREDTCSENKKNSRKYFPFTVFKFVISDVLWIYPFGDWAANLDLCLALMAFSTEVAFPCHIYCDRDLGFCGFIQEPASKSNNSNPLRRDHQIFAPPL